MCYSTVLLTFSNRDWQKSESIVSWKIWVFLFHFFSRMVFSFHARNSWFFFTQSGWDFTHRFFEEIFTQGIVFHAHFRKKNSRKELAFTYTFLKKFTEGLQFFTYKKKHCQSGWPLGKSGYCRLNFTSNPTYWSS